MSCEKTIFFSYNKAYRIFSFLLVGKRLSVEIFTEVTYYYQVGVGPFILKRPRYEQYYILSHVILHNFTTLF